MERSRIEEEQRKIEELQSEENIARAETDIEKARLRVDEMKRNQVGGVVVGGGVGGWCVSVGWGGGYMQQGTTAMTATAITETHAHTCTCC